MKSFISIGRLRRAAGLVFAAALVTLWTAPARAQTTLTLTRLSIDDLYGIDNTAGVGPNLAPIGVRVANTSGPTATNVTITMTLSGVSNTCGAGGTSPCVSIPGINSYVLQTLPSGSTFDYFWVIKLENASNTNAIGTHFTYTVSASATGVTSTPVTSPQETVLSLINQNRNQTAFTSANNCNGGNPIYVGMEFTCTTTSNLNNNNEVRIWQDWDGISFSIDGVSTPYTQNEFNAPSSDCRVPYPTATGNQDCKSQNNLIQTIKLRALAAGTYTIHPFILDNSGASFHYNTGATNAIITVSPNSPTAVGMKRASVRRKGNDAVVTWRTGYEAENLGFRVYRDDPDGRQRLLTPNLIAGSALFVQGGIGLSSGRAYRYVDVNAPEGAAYWVEDVDLHGATTLHAARDAAPAAGRSRRDDGLEPSPLLSEIALSAPASATIAGIGVPPEPEPGALSALGGVTNPAQSNRQLAIAGGLGAKILVKSEGWYRFSRQELIDAGWDPGADPTNLQLWAEGAPVAMLVTTPRAGGYSLEFYGTGLDTVSTDTRVYWLTRGTTPGTRVRTAPAFSTAAQPADFPFAVQRKDRVIYAPGIANGDAESWFGPIVGPPGFPEARQDLAAPNLDPAGAGATLQVAIQGATTGIQHDVAVQVNGHDAGTMSFAGQAHAVGSLSVPVSWLTPGTNAISLAAVNALDYSVVDYVRLTYPHLYAADSDALAFAAAAGTQVSISGFGTNGVRIFDVTNPAAVVAVATTVRGTGPYTASGAVPGGAGAHRLLAVGDGRVATPAGFAANAPSAWNRPSNAADLVIIAHPTLVAAMAPLRNLRQAQGLATQVVDVTDVYDEFGYGEKSTDAIRAFLQAARSWRRPPRYVLLAGDGSLDPRGYLAAWGVVNSDLVPVRLVETSSLKTASDDWYADFANTGLPSMAVGRLPVDTPAQAAAVVAKITGYERATPSRTVTLVADQNDDNDFESAAAALAPLVTGKSVQTLRVGALGSGSKDAITAAFNDGRSIVNWIGHGEATSWSKQDVFDVAQVGALTNGWQLPLVVSMDCLTGYFHDPTQTSLAEALLEAPSAGAVAVWASSALTEFTAQAPADQRLLQKIYGTPAPRLGDAVLAAKAVTPDNDVRRTWILFGDPTATVR